MKNVAEDHEMLTDMILTFVMNRGVVTDRQILDAVNQFGNITAVALQNLLRIIAVEKKLVVASFKVPLKAGQFGTFMVVCVPKTEQEM